MRNQIPHSFLRLALEQEQKEKKGGHVPVGGFQITRITILEPKTHLLAALHEGYVIKLAN